jgi:D-alanyl-D-alanine dipeptidase
MVTGVAGCSTSASDGPSTATSPTATDCSPNSDCATAANGLPIGFVRLSDVDPSILQEMRYPTDHNFVGSPIDGYQASECWVTAQTAAALKQAQRQANAKGYSLKMYDCYRPQRAVSEFMRWAADPNATEMKGEFYPRVAKEELIPGDYIAEKSGHSRGSTVDVTLVPLPGATSTPWTPADGLVDCALPAAQRFPDTSIDMGTGFDCFDVASHTANAKLTPAQRANRDTLVGIMTAAGFKNLYSEWWHYTLNNEPYPTTYFDVPITGKGP